MWDLSSPGRDLTCAPAVEVWILNYWIPRKVPHSWSPPPSTLLVMITYSACLRAHSVASVVSNSATLWTIASQALLSMGFSRQEYWSGLLWLPTGDLPNSGIDFVSLNKYLHWQAGSLPLAPPGKPIM